MVASTGKPVPCEVSLVAKDYHLPIFRSVNGLIHHVPDGAFSLRAFAPGLALSSMPNLTVSSADEPDATPHNAILSLSPGGRLRFDSGLVPAHGALEVLSLSTGRVDIVFTDRERDIPFPAGDFVVIGLAAPHVLVGITKPLSLSPGETKGVASFAPTEAGKGHAVFVVPYPHIDTAGLHDLKLAADRAYHSVVESDKSPFTYYAVFYDVPAGQLPVRIESHFWQTTTTTADIAGGEVTFVQSPELTFKPKLNVTVLTDASQAPAQIRLILHRCPERNEAIDRPDLGDCDVYREEQIAGASKEFHFVDPAIYYVEAQAGTAWAGKYVDLTAGHDVDETLDARSTHLRGKVTRGNTGIVSELQFFDLQSDRLVAKQGSDTDGHYSVTLPNMTSYSVTVTPADSQAPGVRFVLLIDRAEVSHDFEIPATIVTMEVTNRLDGTPVGGAAVSFRDSHAVQRVVTGQDGIANLPPVTPGELKCITRAAGFNDQETVLEIADRLEEQKFRIQLRPKNDENTVRVMLPDGNPAGNAFVFVGSSADIVNGLPPRIGCDEDGACRLPARPSDGTPLFFFHPSAGLTVVEASRAFEAGSVMLEPSGGIAVIELTLGPGHSAEESLMASVSVRGIRVPNGILRVIGSFVSAGPDIVPSTQLRRLRIGGLPRAEVALSIVSATPTMTRFVTESVPLDLPLSSVLTIPIS